MNIRTQITFFLILISLVGVTATSFFILQLATQDKKNYVTELSSVLSPQIKDSIDQKVRALLLDLRDFTAGIEKNTAASQLESLKARLKNVDTLVLIKPGKMISIRLNAAEDAPLPDLSALSAGKINPPDRDQLAFLQTHIYLFRTSQNNLAAVVLNPEFFRESFDLARGKKSLLLSRDKKLLFTNKNSIEDAAFAAALPSENFSGPELLTTETSTGPGQVVVTNFSKLKSIQNSFVVIVTPQVTWQDLAAPLFKSSLSLIIVLILFSVIIAYYISLSLAKPIELLVTETSKVGIGEWKPITSVESKNEIAKLARAFNSMIANLINRENELKIAHNKIIQSESLAAVGRMSAGIAHEVKNPLSSVLSYCQLIEISLKTSIDAEKIEKFKNYNQLVMDDTRRASKIISGLLTFSRQKEIQTEKVNALTYLTGLHEKLGAVCEANQVQFQLVHKLDDSHFLKIDGEQLYQVLFNLVQNAVHAVHSTEAKSVQLQAEGSGESLVISVTDNGPGISPENITKIFEPFFSTKKGGEGSGLGLSICYGIILQHGGQISVESVPNHTCFRIKLPLAA